MNNILDNINEICTVISNEIPITYERVKDLKDYEKPEFLRLLANFRFSNMNLDAHDEDLPDYDTIQEDFYELMVDGLKFRNYCDLIAFGNYQSMNNVIDDVKTLYYKYFNELQEESYTC